MEFFNFFKRKKKNDPLSPPIDATIDTSKWTGKDFEFLITGNFEISEDIYDKTMTPNSFEWTKITKEDCSYYQVGEDQYTFSWEMVGIQMTFNESMSYQKAKTIADEVVENVRATGQAAELMILDKTKVYRFN